MALADAGVPLMEMSRTECFSAAHRLHSDDFTDAENLETFGKCNNASGHGHNYKVVVTVRGPVDPRDARRCMVMNLQELKRVLQIVMAEVDHKNLDIDVPYFKQNGVVSTTENVTYFLWRRISEEMLAEHRPLLCSVTVHETDKNVFTFRGDYAKS